VFVGQLEDRQVVANDLNRTLLARLIEEKIIDPSPVPELRLRDLDKIAAILKPVPTPEGPTPEGPTPAGATPASPSPPPDAAAPPTS
jgi:potassium efflux system protein